MTDIDRFLRDPNGPAYRKDEVRNGPPLNYVSEKIRSALDAQQQSLRELDAWAASERPVGTKEPVAGESVPLDLDATRNSALAAFHYLITAFLALNNMLGSHTGHDYVKRLQSMPGEDFDRWLAFIEREGSISDGG